MKHFKLVVLVGLVTVFFIAGMAFAQGQGGQGKGGQGAPMTGCQQQFDLIDTNHDGKISKEEFMVHAEGMFKSMDTNGDGVLTKDELTCCKGMGGGCAGCPGCPGGGCKGKGTGQGMGYRHGQTKGTTQ
jgi:hypothetical protein